MTHYEVVNTPNLAAPHGLAKRIAGTGMTVNAVLPGPALPDSVRSVLGSTGRKRRTHSAVRRPMSSSRHNTDLARRNQLALEIDYFARCILAGREPHTPEEEGVQDHPLIKAINRAVSNSKPVSLPPTPGVDAFRGPALER